MSEEGPDKVFRKALLDMREAIIEEARAKDREGIAARQEDRPDMVDRSTIETDRNFMLRLLDRDRKLLKKVDEALKRLEEGGYGECDRCGEPISRDRLLARPVATLCIACKEIEEIEENQLK